MAHLVPYDERERVVVVAEEVEETGVDEHVPAGEHERVGVGVQQHVHRPSRTLAEHRM